MDFIKEFNNVTGDTMYKIYKNNSSTVTFCIPYEETKTCILISIPDNAQHLYDLTRFYLQNYMKMLEDNQDDPDSHTPSRYKMLTSLRGTLTYLKELYPEISGCPDYDGILHVSQSTGALDSLAGV